MRQLGQQQQENHRKSSNSYMANNQRLGAVDQDQKHGQEQDQEQEQDQDQDEQPRPQQIHHQRFFPSGDVASSLSAAASMPPVPQTPFDPTYGASLLPSHMLMGSPFVSTPMRPQGHFHPSASSHSNHSRSFLYYPQPPILKPIPPRRRKSFSLNHSEPYQVNFKILPKGKDEYMTRSLLFSNLERQENFDIHNFLTNFIKFGPIESIYLLDDSHSILLSFLTKATCLDFYNNLLQRFSEFKSKLHSTKLSVSFVCQDETNWFRLLQMNVVTRGVTRSLCIEFEDQSMELTSDLIHEKIPWLFFSHRFVIERIDLVNAAAPKNQNFNNRYLLIHFICISMALEVEEYLQQASQKKQLGISKIQFVNVNGHSSDLSDEDAVAAANGLQRESRTSSVSSISLPISNSSDLVELFHSLDLALGIISLQVIPSEYPVPLIESHDDHLHSVTISRPSKTLTSSTSLVEMDGGPNGGTPNGSNAMQGVLLLSDPSSDGNTPSMLPNELNINTSLMPGPMGGQVLGTSQSLSLHNPNDNGGAGPSYFMDPMSGAPINQALQRQYLTGTGQVGGSNNRTVYIGNIHPRSKPEDICNVVRGGILQNIKWIHSKRICFVTFIEAAAAIQFYANASLEPIVLHGNILRVGWGQPSGELPKNIALAVTIGASRNVYVSLPEYSFKEKYINNPEFKEYHGKYKLPSEEQLRQDFTKYGQVEQINYLDDGHCCWVNFMNIAHAIRLVEDCNSLSQRNLEKFHAQFDGRYKNLIIGYGKDRCGNVNKNLTANKNSRFFKKIKKLNCTTKPNKRQQSKRGTSSASSDDARKDDASTEKVPVSSKEPVCDEILGLNDDNALAEGLGISLSSAYVNEYGDDISKRTNKKNRSKTETVEEDTGYTTSGSSDIDIIVAPPLEHNKGKEGNSNHGKSKRKSQGGKRLQNGAQDGVGGGYGGHSQHYLAGSFELVNSNTYLDSIPPLVPSPINQHFHDKSLCRGSAHVNDNNNALGGFNNYSYNCGGSNNGNRTRRRRQAKFSKPIAGQDVMSQYLEQLHHSTFLYSTNILGATTVHDPLGFYDVNANEP
ncbi:Nab6p Ecym_4615 [Eremothecium cymbalariae DBVPG|uniref:RRM domain-containing protein n=1 Tax=Eremothecium cymbalariae (strain CBS 270.75 / DBVPG 7215 / KCTC 17166 / NRRL Y-17582) TaxID=931890 RepID=G8JSC2_ERECY|nr:hypothetical protein Ecym_4615 [Eremothecium cymbalariae DBVPG\